MNPRMRSLALLVALAVSVNAACGSTAEVTIGQKSDVEVQPVTNEPQPATNEPSVVVDADETIAVGDLTIEQRGMVEWALHRFALLDLKLPPQVEFVFDPTGERCDGNAGRCLPPNGHAIAVVCEPSGETLCRIIDRRVTLLHELAHLWHWGLGDGLGWPDRTRIVGGEVGSAEVPWEDRAEERVAMAVAWGLMDQLRRPVGSEFPCAELNAQFQKLTGHEPLGPIEGVCEL